jgi:hypothetical protein
MVMVLLRHMFLHEKLLTWHCQRFVNVYQPKETIKQHQRECYCAAPLPIISVRNNCGNWLILDGVRKITKMPITITYKVPWVITIKLIKIWYFIELL